MLSKKKGMAIIAGLAVTFLILVWLERMEEQENLAQAGRSAPAPLRVSTAPVTLGPVSRWIMAEGRAEAVRKSYLQFEEPGKIVLLGTGVDGTPLREGMRVSGPDRDSGAPGQLLARIDSRDKLSEVSQGQADYLAAQQEIDMLRAAMHQAEDDLSESRKDHDRKRKLLDQQFIAQSVYDEARFRFTKAQSALSAARLNVAAARTRLGKARAELNKVNRSPEKRELRAPFDGVIARINIKMGDYCNPDNVIHTTQAELAATAPVIVIDPSEMEIVLHLPEREGREVMAGQQVIVCPGIEGWSKGMTLQTAPKVDGTVYSVSPQIDGKHRSIRVKVRFGQAATTITDGLFASCWIKVAENTQATRIPLSALLFDGSQPYVFVNDNGMAARRDLALGLRDTRFAEVISGIKTGQSVICGGRRKLTHGTPVIRVEPPASPEVSHAAQ